MNIRGFLPLILSDVIKGVNYLDDRVMELVSPSCTSHRDMYYLVRIGKNCGLMHACMLVHVGLQ